jgi:hypothetical protein
LHLTHLFRQSDFLQEEIALAKAFHSAYSNRLSAEHLRALQQLIRLEDAPYWKKKITFEKSFRPHWKNRFS